MRWNVLGVGFGVCSLTIGSASAHPMLPTTPTPTHMTPGQAESPQLVGEPGVSWQVEASAWLRETMLDRLTIPLGTVDRHDFWPFGFGGLSGAGAIQ
jgi:hypothetical protein